MQVLPLFCKLPALRLWKASISTKHITSICLLKLQCICCHEFQRPKKQRWEKSNYCRNFSEVWSRILNDPRRMNSRRCACSLRDKRGRTWRLLRAESLAAAGTEPARLLDAAWSYPHHTQRWNMSVPTNTIHLNAFLLTAKTKPNKWIYIKLSQEDIRWLVSFSWLVLLNKFFFFCLWH